MTNNLPYKYFPDHISPTSAGMYTQCPHKWLLTYCYHIRKASSGLERESGSVNLDAGAAYAYAMMLTRQAFYVQKLSAPEAVEVGQRYLLGTFATQFAASPYSATEKVKTPTNLSITFARYFAEADLDLEQILPFQLPDKSISVELPLFLDTPFKHPLTRKPIKLLSILDLLGADSDGTIAVDEKTTRSTLKSDTAQIELLRTETQFAFQVGMANKLAPLLKIPPCNRMQVRKVVINGTPALRKYDFFIEHTHQKLWWSNVLEIINAMLKDYEKERAIRSFHLGCTSYFTPCEFTTACTSRLGEHLLSNGYTQQFRNRETNTLLPLAAHIANVKAGLNPTTGE